MRGPRGSPPSPPNADGWPPAPARTGPTPQLAPNPLPPSPRRALHGTAHGTTLMHREVVGRAHLPPRMPTRITVMADSDGSPKRDDRHHRRSRSGSPVSPKWAGETPAEREERRLAEAAVLAGLPAGQRRAASADTGPWTLELEPAEVTAPAAQAASPAAPPREGAPDVRGAQTAASASHAAAQTAAPGTPPTRGVALAQEPGASPRAAAAAEGSGEGARGVATAAPASRATAAAGHAAAASTPRKQANDPARATGASPVAADAAAVGREGTKYRAHANPTHTHTSPPKPFPPKPFPPGRTRHVRPPASERLPPGVTLPQLQRQRDARGVIEEGGNGAQAELRASHGSAERRTGGDRGSAQEHAQRAGQGTRGREQERSSGGGADGTTQGREPGRGRGTGRARRGAGGAPRCMERAEGRLASGQDRAWMTGGGTHGTGRGPEGGPRARASAPRVSRDRREGAWEPKGEGRVEGRGAGGGAPPQPDVQQERCIPPGIQQMLAHHTHHHHPHHHHLYTIDPDTSELIPPQPPRPRHQPAPPAPRAELARMASAGGGSGRGTGVPGTGAAEGASASSIGGLAPRLGLQHGPGPSGG